MQAALKPISVPPSLIAPIPIKSLLHWALFSVLLLVIIYFVGAEGATSLIKGVSVHEFLHDGRHLLGFPYH